MQDSKVLTGFVPICSDEGLIITDGSELKLRPGPFAAYQGATQFFMMCHLWLMALSLKFKIIKTLLNSLLNSQYLQ